ncbi:M2 family metallopeptidase, partial [Marisediminitalea aggregata]|uniref:M2 family metallopeptidase n=1 Tax=Marisediminitalea aggregata TaxID=634436 RepID=UPI0020CD97E3
PDVTAALRDQDYDEIKMVKQAESFFSSLGFDELPDSFWTNSQFSKPADRDVQCHASAWNVDNVDDLRIKMCIQITGEEFNVIHHELGHNYYQRAYNQQPFLYQGSANDGFHEAIGDTIALSITPKYLKEIGLIDEIPDPSNDIGMLLQVALDKIAFIPFGLMVDQWRWKVMAGEAGPEEYNKLWWELREKYQGVMAPVARDADAFDPGAKYHVPANVPYTRYFLAHILQFQFHKALCDIAGDNGPLNRCSIYGSEEAGTALNEMLEMGQSRPWQEALATITGLPDMDASTIEAYFAPLKTWLDEQNKDRQCGW